MLSGTLQSVIDERLASVLAHLGAKKVFFEMLETPRALNLPEGPVTYEVKFDDERILNARKATVVIRVNGKVLDSLQIQGRVRVYMPVVAAARPLSRGDVLSPGDLAVKEAEIGSLRRPCLDPEAAVGKRVKHTVPMGEVLEENDLELPILVKRRETVIMILERGRLQIEARGVAAADGRQGEMIPVQTMGSRKTVACEVVGRKAVKVVF
ncbi:MAG: flagellar basal body P-ring formation protein FlgA [Deltaproteobacteria bacterium]|nr:flagellar basal body P-ring formation protein FlgA [Deltaproteobacteria bacterium]